MDLRQLENFIEVCGHMSFTKAAKNLFISQQGISKSIKSLEEELGVKLFYRASSSIVLTEYGFSLLKYAKEIDAIYKNALEDMESIRSRNANELCIGIPHGLVNILPAEMLAAFNHTHQALTVRMSEYSDLDLDEALLAGQIDIGFCIAPIPETGFTVHHIHHEQTYYMLSENHILADQKNINIGQLKDELFIGFGEKNKGHSVLLERCRREGFTPKMGMQAQDMQLIKEMCRCGLGIGFFVGDPDTRLQGLRIIPDSKANWDYDVCISTVAGRYLSAGEKEFLAVISAW